MAIAHLTDEQIQDYLDGNLSQEQVAILEGHIETCQNCQWDLAQYQSLLAGLKEDVAFDLSPGFSNTVMKTIRTKSQRVFLARLWNVLLPFIGIAAGIGAIIYYVDFKPYLKVFVDSLNPAQYFDSAILSNLNQILIRLNVNLNLIVFAGLSLVAVIVLDHLFARYKAKLLSYLRTLPILIS